MSDLIVKNDMNIVAKGDGNQDYVTVVLAGQLLGIPVLAVHDVLNQQRITKIPLSEKWVAGVLNLRGRIVTAIDLRVRLGLPAREDGEKSMSIVVEHREEPYSLQIDTVGEVLSLSDELFEKNPITLDARWREISKGIYRLENELMAVLDVEKLLEIDAPTKAA